MISLDDLELQNIIYKEVSSFALSIIDIKSSEIIYSNNAMKDFMIDTTAKKCWESIYGQNSKCSWCYVKNILNIDDINVEKISEYENEYFNEKTNKWYQIQNKITKLKDGTDILVSIALDISNQKEALGKFISTQVKLVQQTQKLEETKKKLKVLASIDSMTKLFNRRYFIEISKSILDIAKRNKTDTAIIMLDIDKFKKINDTYGHKVGDNVIIALASILREQSRKSDIISRWGGEEFVMLLSNTNTDGALVISEKIRKAIEDLRINVKDAQELKFTVSIGISKVAYENNIDIEDSINQADEALYEAKKSGRNKVCIKYLN